MNKKVRAILDGRKPLTRKWKRSKRSPRQPARPQKTAAQKLIEQQLADEAFRAMGPHNAVLKELAEARARIEADRFREQKAIFEQQRRQELAEAKAKRLREIEAREQDWLKRLNAPIRMTAADQEKDHLNQHRSWISQGQITYFRVRASMEEHRTQAKLRADARREFRKMLNALAPILPFSQLPLIGDKEYA